MGKVYESKLVQLKNDLSKDIENYSKFKEDYVQDMKAKEDILEYFENKYSEEMEIKNKVIKNLEREVRELRNQLDYAKKLLQDQEDK